MASRTPTLRTMNPMQRLISAGFATAALAAASVPALAFTLWPAVDFPWHADAAGPVAVRASADPTARVTVHDRGAPATRPDSRACPIEAAAR